MDLFLIQIRVSRCRIEENITDSYLNLGAKILNPCKIYWKVFFEKVTEDLNFKNYGKIYLKFDA